MGVNCHVTPSLTTSVFFFYFTFMRLGKLSHNSGELNGNNVLFYNSFCHKGPLILKFKNVAHLLWFINITWALMMEWLNVTP